MQLGPNFQNKQNFKRKLQHERQNMGSCTVIGTSNVKDFGKCMAQYTAGTIFRQ